MSNKIFQSKNKGFTLIEVLAAVFILTVAIFAIFNVIQNLSIYYKTASSRLTAAYLAQEGMELARNKRDTSLIQGLGWDSDLPEGTEIEYNLLGKFERETEITSDPTLNKITVEVEVSWQEMGKDYSVEAETHLYGWY